MEKHLINTTEELQKFVRINISVLRESFLPYELDARNKFIIPYIGQQLHDELIELNDSNTYPDWVSTPKEEKMLMRILYYTQNALAKFTIYLAAPHMDLHLSEMGFVVTNTQHSAPASAQRVAKAVNAFYNQGFDNLEALLGLIEANHDKIPSYINVTHSIFSTGSLIISATEFNKIFPIGNSRIRFAYLVPELQKVTGSIIIPAIGKAFFDHLLEGKQNLSLDTNHQKLLEKLQLSTAYFTMAGALSENNIRVLFGPMPPGTLPREHPSEATIKNTTKKYSSYAKSHLLQATKLMLSNPGHFPVYKNSPLYNQHLREKPFENLDSGIFIFGHPSN